MRFKTPFRLAICAIGIFVTVQGTAKLIGGPISWIIEGMDTGLSWSFYLAQILVYAGAELICGLFLMLRANWIANIFVPGSRRYCHECGYDLSRASLEGECSECGTPFSIAVQDLTRGLRVRWRELHGRLHRHADPTLCGAAFEDLRRRYSAPERAYHNLYHIAACLHVLDQSKDDATYADLVELAIWFHDAVYDPQRSDNEQQSAALAAAHASALQLIPSHVQALERMILTTSHAAAPVDTDDELIADIDLSILGAPESEYDRYAARIRQEYSFAGEADFRAGRAKVLRGFLERRRIFGTSRLRARFETPARANLTRELESLELH